MDELTRTLLVGTAQTSGAAVPAPAPAVEAIVAGAAIDTPRERQLLLRAGAQAVYRRAGRLPLVAPPASARPAAAADEQRRITSPALTALLQPLFAERQLTIVPEALALLAEHGLVLAPELLPDALDLPDAGVRKALLPVLGERGRWLAAQVPRWRWATVLAGGDRLPDDADARFEEGSAETRLALFALARRVDQERARRWIAAAWSEEKADQRAAFLEAFAAQLAPADEPFLDAALTDRSGQVRPIAARLLWRLPGSALSQRMRARADALVRLQPGLPRASGIMGRMKAAFAGAPAAPVALEVSLPAERFDPAWGKDGVLEPPPQGTGRRQWWLAQIMAAVPPTHWQSPERLGLAPDAFVAAARAHELGDVLVDGLAAATLRFLPAAHAFLVPLWNAMRARAGPSLLLPRPLESLLAAMSPEERERCALAIFSADSPGIDPSLLLALPRPWPSSVADAFIDSGAYTPAGARGWHGHLLSEAALAFPRSHLGFQLPVPPDANAYLRRSFDDFQSTLELRRRLHEEILRDPTLA